MTPWREQELDRARWWSKQWKKFASDVREERQLREKMAEILTAVAAELKGDPGELQIHGWSDLPELAKKAMKVKPNADEFGAKADLIERAKSVLADYHRGQPDSMFDNGADIIEQLLQVLK